MSKYTFFEYFPKIVNPWFGQKSDCFIKSFFFSTLALQKRCSILKLILRSWKMRKMKGN